MPKTELSTLPDDTRIWMFGITPAVDEHQASIVLGAVDTFLDSWAAHGTPITSSAALIDHTFLVIAVDKQSETSGCSIDRMFGLFRQLERELNVKILDADRVFFRHGSGAIDAMSRAEFRDRADLHTIVFDTTAERLGEVRGGGWEKRAEESWHRQLLEAR